MMAVDGIREQVEWQCAEVGRLLAPLGMQDAQVLDGTARDEAWRQAGLLGHRGLDDAAAVMRWALLPTQLAELVPGAPLALAASWDAPAVVAAIARTKLPVELSHHAGTYACNAALYLALHAARAAKRPAAPAPRTRTVFVDIPPA